MKNFMDARIKELMGMNATFAEAHAAALAEWKEMNGKPAKQARKGTGKAASEAKPQKTRKEAIDEWKVKQGITEESAAKYKAMMDSTGEWYQSRWEARKNDPAYKAMVEKDGKKAANKAWHKKLSDIASAESKK